MEDKTYKITLTDGTVLDNLKLNGNNFISDTPIDEEMFTDNCASVTISDGSTEELHENMVLVQIMKINEEYHFILRDLSTDEIERIKTRADIEYIAMMTEVEL